MGAAAKASTSGAPKGVRVMTAKATPARAFCRCVRVDQHLVVRAGRPADGACPNGQSERALCVR
eukprot:8957476-Lingulodinium_polyedra.AAC.1